MRYHLYETNAESVSLSGELEFLESYVSLMKMRSTSMLEVNFTYHLENEGTLIAPLLFVPLVENAFKYGISNDYKSFITIDIQEKDHELSASFENTIFANPDALSEHSGIGLENLKKRLLLIYPHLHTIKTDQIDHQFIVHLSIQLA
jgi:LytS/YehU family sensor histidine kinase